MYTYKLPKYNWTLLVTTTAKSRLSANFINLVQRAYEKTSQGSFVNSMSDVVASNWIAYDWDKDPEADSVLFFRLARPNDPWKGYKIQGIGHDTQKVSIDKVLTKVREQLKKPGWWIEASDAMEYILYKDKMVPVITDEFVAQRLFPNTNLKMLNTMMAPGRYSRKAGSMTIRETCFGRPEFRRL
jgi:hypothetical protein